MKTLLIALLFAGSALAWTPYNPARVVTNILQQGAFSNKYTGAWSAQSYDPKEWVWAVTNVVTNVTVTLPTSPPFPFRNPVEAFNALVYTSAAGRTAVGLNTPFSDQRYALNAALVTGELGYALSTRLVGGVPAPVNPLDPANKAYVDSATNGVWIAVQDATNVVLGSAIVYADAATNAAFGAAIDHADAATNAVLASAIGYTDAATNSIENRHYVDAIAVSNIANGLILGHNSNAVAVIVRRGQQIGCTSVYHALSQLASGDVVFFMPGTYGIDDCSGDRKPWNTKGLTDIALIGLGNVTLRAHGYTANEFPLLFKGVTNFTMSNITIDAHRINDGYTFGVNFSRNVLIERCKFFLRADGTATTCKTLVVLSISNNIVRDCVIGTFSGLQNSLFHMATHGEETVIADSCVFVDGGTNTSLTVGALATRNCYATSLFGSGIQPLPLIVAKQCTDHLYDAFVGGYGGAGALSEPLFAYTPIKDRHIIISPSMPNILGYCGNTFAGAVPNGFTGMVRVVGVYKNGSVLAPRDVTNIHAVIDYSGSRLLMGYGGCVIEVPRVHNSYVEFRNLVMTDVGTAGNPASFGVRVLSCTNSTFVLINSVHELAKTSDRMIPLSAPSADGNSGTRCATYNCIRVTYTNVVFGLNQYGTIDNMTLDLTNGFSAKAILTP